MNIIATAFLIHFSNVSTFFITSPNFETLKTNINENMITGNPVAIAKIEGIRIGSLF